MTTSAIRVVVSGNAATYPFGGVFWDYMQYVLGLRRLGHDVLYVEDTGVWSYDPVEQTFFKDGGRNAAYLERQIASLDPDLADRWFFRDVTGKTYGRRWSDVVDFCSSADLLINISASDLIREEYFANARTVLIDSDPLYTQARLLNCATEAVRDSLEWCTSHHDVFFTLAENIDAPDCTIPTGPVEWTPTRQPVVLDRFDPAAVPVASRRKSLTTVASWEPLEQGPVVNGVKYAGKSAEFERFIDLPSHSVLPIEVGLSGPAPTERLRTHGWALRDGYEVSYDPSVYRDYLATSMGELGLAKSAYVASNSGWFSCRTACYLALGVPAIAQDTGFSRTIPTGEGLLSFTTPEEAAHAIERLTSDPNRHAEAARAIAEEYFDSDKVLGQLIEAALAG